MEYLKFGWKFKKGIDKNALGKDFDDSSWREVRVPHDYAIEGPFSADYDVQNQVVVADGITKPLAQLGRTGGLPITDHATYRKVIEIPKDTKNAFIEFDGVMSNSTIYMNGEKCGERPYGYSSFSVDITKLSNFGEKNMLAVTTEPEPLSSRWYSGAGIYRNVRLVLKEEIYFPYLPAFVEPIVDGEDASIDCSMKIENFDKKYDVVFEIYDAKETLLDTFKTSSSDKTVSHSFKINKFNRWHVFAPYLYNFKAKLLLDGNVVDCYETTFGIRTVSFDVDKGFFLNGENVKLRGVCLHHDEGALGAIVNRSVIERKLDKLISMGTNSIRTSHNPPSPEFLDVCDEKGLLVIDEAFDNWKLQKTDNNYGKYFDEWAEIDLVTMIHRDRNHPSIFMWSIGNEIDEQRVVGGNEPARFLAQICKREDPNRKTTAGFNAPDLALKHGLWDEIDVVGVNYKPFNYERYHKERPDVVLYSSETSSCISSRGEYYLKPNTSYNVDELKSEGVMRDNYHCCSYDTEGLPWSCPPDREFMAQKAYDFIFGEYVWTGFDYLGEPSPYRKQWPSRSSYFGIIDLCGIEKDRYYSYKSYWTSEDVLHIFPHWNWNKGDIVDVHAYSNYDEVELFLNGESLGISKKDPNHFFKNHRHIWENIKFVKGELKAVAVSNPKLVDVVKTASYPVDLLIEPEKTSISADGEEVVYIRCTAVDSNGVVCPKANFRLDFETLGACEYLASDNGDPTDLRIFSKPYCNLFNGKCMIILRSVKDKIGDITVNITSDVVHEKSVSLTAKH